MTDIKQQTDKLAPLSARGAPIRRGKRKGMYRYLLP